MYRIENATTMHHCSVLARPDRAIHYTHVDLWNSGFFDVILVSCCNRESSHIIISQSVASHSTPGAPRQASPAIIFYRTAVPAPAVSRYKIADLKVMPD